MLFDLCVHFAILLNYAGVIAGQNYRHQLELIFNVVGSPSDDYISMTSDIIGDFLRSMKHPLCLLYHWSLTTYVTLKFFFIVDASVIDSLLVLSSLLLQILYVVGLEQLALKPVRKL